MRYKITYTPKHKQILEDALNMALAWHDGDIKPVVDLMAKAYKRHHPDVDEKHLENSRIFIETTVQELRDLDTEGSAFGKYDVLASIKLSDTGESVLSDLQTDLLMKLAEKVTRLIVGQVSICFVYCRFSLPLDTLYKFENLTSSLHCVCWDMTPNASYGIRYSEESDILWDIYQVIRYQSYLNSTEEEKEKIRWTVWADKPLHTAREPLIGITTIPD